MQRFHFFSFFLVLLCLFLVADSDVRSLTRLCVVLCSRHTNRVKKSWYCPKPNSHACSLPFRLVVVVSSSSSHGCRPTFRFVVRFFVDRHSVCRTCWAPPPPTAAAKNPLRHPPTNVR